METLEICSCADLLPRQMLSPNEDVIGVANIAKRCLNLNGKKRPTMKQVSSDLERIFQLSQKKDVQQNNEEAESIAAEVISARDDASTSITCTSFQVDQALLIII
ncbi:hypothetical protein POTOM_033705 [Populus tomentosa]|uniref:Uncharacterized protein n=1 Tax=Populus tomentosa TaxID=118781 RepID=A0A8X7Z8F0_POPTO|nr:hypothetical protein POTOM_033705 [Populus tomentosa]